MSLRMLLSAFILMLTLTITSLAQVENMHVVSKLQDKAPDGSTIATLNQPSINNRSDVVFLTTDTSTPRLLITKDIFGTPKTEVLVQRGTNVVGLDNAKIFRMLSPKVNDNGDILFTGSISSLPIDGGLFLFSQGQVKPVALVNAATPIGGVFTGDLALTNSFGLNNRGDVVFLTKRATADILSAIFLVKDQVMTKVVAEGETILNIGKIQFDSTTAPAINENGDVLFSAATQENPLISTVYLFSNGVIKKIVAPGDPSPQGGTFEQVSSPGRYLNNKGEILFIGKTGGKDGIYLFSPENNKITKLVADDDTAPDGGVFRSLSISLTPAHGRLTNKSSFVFRGSTTKTIYGLFYYANGKILKVVGRKDPTPLGGVFADEAIFNAAFLGSIISDNDEVVFEATIRGGSATKALIAWSTRLAPIKVTSAIYNNKTKVLQIKTSSINIDIKIEINGKINTQSIKLVSDTELSIKGSRKRLNLNKAANTNKLVLISSNGVRSEIFTF